jgi:hypothetical protein
MAEAFARLHGGAGIEAEVSVPPLLATTVPSGGYLPVRFLLVDLFIKSIASR